MPPPETPAQRDSILTQAKTTGNALPPSTLVVIETAFAILEEAVCSASDLSMGST